MAFGPVRLVGHALVVRIGEGQQARLCLKRGCWRLGWPLVSAA